MKKILFVHITGAPITKGSDMGFTEGGLPHILSASTDLRDDYDIEVICPNLPGDSREKAAVHKGVKIVSLGTSSWVKGYSRMPGLSFYRRAYTYIRKKNPDILIGNNFLASLLLRPLPSRITKIGIIHHLYLTQNSGLVTSAFQPTVRKIGQFERLTIRFLSLNGIGAISPQVKQALVTEGYPADRIVVVGNGVDLDSYRFSPSKTPGTLIFVGRLAELKGVDSLIHVVRELKRSIGDLTLHIVGRGPKEDGIRRRIQDLKVSDSVILHGYVTEREKIDLLLESKIYVSNSKFEGFGIPLVEAMATGTVPVVSDIDSHRWVFQGERVGYLVKNEDEMAARILHLLKNEPERQSLAENGRRLVQREWSWQKVSGRYRELLSKSITTSQVRISSGPARPLSRARQ